MMRHAFAAAGLAAFAFLAAACQPSERAPAAAAPSGGETPYVAAANTLEAGRHIAVVGGCNDCHTAGYTMYGEAIPEADRLKGSPMGHYGAWGTSYASNLRIVAASMTEDEWVEMMATRRGLPPMPWELMHQYDARDMRALYAYIRSLGDVGEPVPASMPGAGPPQGPYTDYVTHAGPPPPPPAGFTPPAGAPAAPPPT